MTDTQSRALPKYALTLDRVLDAPVEKVWRCWTEPELLEQWFCPKPWRATEVKMDLRPGGEMTSVFRGPNGESFPNAGVFLEIVPMRRIVSTDAFRAGWIPSDSAYMVAETQFAEAGQGRTHFIWKALHWTEEAMKGHEAMGFHEGWGMAANQLEALAKTL
jgi:uncharacterized protein YndB with AHSA1/START domain